MGGNILSPPSLATMGVALPAATGGRVLQGMKMGAGYGAAQPVTGDEDFLETKAKQAGIGAVTGGAVPVVGAGFRKGAGYIDELAKPLYEKGIAKVVIRNR